MNSHNLTNPISLKEEEMYTKFGVNMMAVTTKTQFQLIKIINKNEFIVRIKDNKTNRYKKSLFRIKLEKDSFIVEGHTDTHGIYTDSEVKLSDGCMAFIGDANLNLVHADKVKLANLVNFAYQHDLSDISERTRFYQIHQDSDGIYRDETPIELFEAEEINTPF